MSQREHGVVLTYVENLDQLEDCVRRGGYNTVKVVTGWGVEGGWTSENMARVLHMVPHVIVRTVAGDPSSSRPDSNNDFPEAERIEQEISPWYHIKPAISIEIGNEPNIKEPDDNFIRYWRYHLSRTIEHCRQKFPQARLISGGLMMKGARRFCELAYDAMRDCDYIGLHVYEYYGFHASQQRAMTGDLRYAVELYNEFFAGKPWYITEYGINDTQQVTQAEKGYRYVGTVHMGESHPPLPSNVRGAVYYHLGMMGDLHPEYHIYPEGDERYHERTERLPRGKPEAPVSGTIGVAIPQMTALLATLTSRERELTALRDEATSDSGANFTVADSLELHQVQALIALLEAALACAQDNSLVAQQLVATAASSVDAWRKRQQQAQASSARSD